MKYSSQGAGRFRPCCPEPRYALDLSGPQGFHGIDNDIPLAGRAAKVHNACEFMIADILESPVLSRLRGEPDNLYLAFSLTTAAFNISRQRHFKPPFFSNCLLFR